VEDAIFESTVYRPAIIVANKADTSEATKNRRELEQFVDNQFTVIPTSCTTGYGLEKLGAEIFKALEIIRVYTKEPSDKEPSSNPFILKRGVTISDLAKQIHSDFVKRFSYARVWSKRLPFSPQKVGSTFTLEDRDVVELHVK